MYIDLYDGISSPSNSIFLSVGMIHARFRICINQPGATSKDGAQISGISDNDLSADLSRCQRLFKRDESLAANASVKNLIVKVANQRDRSTENDRMSSTAPITCFSSVQKTVVSAIPAGNRGVGNRWSERRISTSEAFIVKQSLSPVARRRPRTAITVSASAEYSKAVIDQGQLERTGLQLWWHAS